MSSDAPEGIFCILANYLYDKIETNTETYASHLFRRI
jgi:hypothetical protein